MEENPIRIAEIGLGLSDVNLLGVEDPADEGEEAPLRVHIECRGERPRCSLCDGKTYAKGSSLVELADLTSFGRRVRLVWHKRRWVCADPQCGGGSFSDQDSRIATPSSGSPIGCPGG